MWRFKVFILYLLLSESYVHAALENIRKSTNKEEGFKSGSQKNLKPYSYDRLYDQQSSVASYSKERKKRNSLTEDPCFQRGQCESNKDENSLVCYCDSYCRYFKDCCYDAQINSDSAVQLPDFELFKCGLYPYQYLYNTYSWMVVDCPFQYKNQAVKDHCVSRKKLINKVPVYDKNGIMYANAYCAICNDVKDYITSIVAYDSTQCFDDIENFNTVCATKSYRFEPPEGYNLRYCFNYTRSNSINDKCTYYQNPIYHASSLFKNYFCDIGVNPDIGHRCIDTIKTSESSMNNQHHSAFPLTVIFSFSKPGIVEDKSFCQTEEDFHADIVSMLSY